MRWLVVSIVLSIALTIALNVGLRAFPDAERRAARRLEELAVRRDDEGGDRNDRRVRVIVPWKAMTVASIVLTIALNLIVRFG